MKTKKTPTRILTGISTPHISYYIKHTFLSTVAYECPFFIELKHKNTVFLLTFSTAFAVSHVTYTFG